MSVIDFNLPSTYRIAAAHSAGQRRRLTLVPGAGASGTRRFFDLRPGFYAAASEVMHDAGTQERYASGDFIKLHVRLAGESLVSQPGSAPRVIEPLSINTLLQPCDAWKIERFLHVGRERSVSICCSRDFLVNELGLAPGPELGGPIGEFLSAPPTGFRMAQFSLSAQMQAAAESLLAASGDGPLDALQAEAKAFELLYGVIKAGDQRVAESIHLAQTLLGDVKRFIDEHLAEPLDVHTLARRFGFSDRQLLRLFKAAWSLPPSAYVSNARARRALTLLQTTRYAIADIAQEVGYSHTGNFSTAFRRHFGISPSAARLSGNLRQID